MERTRNDNSTASEIQPGVQTLSELVASIIDSAEVEKHLHPAIEIIRDYDAKNQTNLLHTLDVYLLNDCNAQHCGRLLFLHRNSLVYRIHRVQEIAGIDLSDAEERSYLRLSFLLWNALQREI